MRIASTRGSLASGTQMSPLLPPATIPSSAKKAIAALRLWRVVECPQAESVRSTRFRLTGPSAERSAARTYSIVSSVGLAPRFANLGVGDRGTVAMAGMYEYIHYMYPCTLRAGHSWMIVERDAESVRHIHEDDDSVDLLHERVFQEIVGQMKTGDLDTEVGARYILVSRYLERIADHAVNIGERVVYMVTGERTPRVRAVDRVKGGRG